MNRRQGRVQGEPSEAEFERIANHIETAGCSCCGHRFGGSVPYLVARTRQGWVGRCLQPDCVSDFLPCGPVFVDTGVFANDPWTGDDRDWFRANPRCTWRLRWPMPGEVETLATDEQLAEQANISISDHARGALRRWSEGATIAIAVHQFEPGKRLRSRKHVRLSPAQSALSQSRSSATARPPPNVRNDSASSH
jgi:hypothetical protein